MTDYQSIAAAYLAAFNATDPDERRRRVEAVFAPGIEYADPLATVSGHDQLDQLIAGVQAQFPGWRFRLVGAVDGHGGRLRFGWGLGPASDEPPVLGFDVAILDGEDRIVAVHGFLDRVPVAAA